MHEYAEVKNVSEIALPFCFAERSQGDGETKV
jgi:hypothetical protein